ncbi:hypothetical protein ACQ4PT_005549 [Festuca glaucescens]
MATSSALSRLLRAARKVSIASRNTAAAASRAATMASRSAREAEGLRSGIRDALEIWQTHDHASTTKPCNCAPIFDYIVYFNSPEYQRLPEDAKTPTDKDLESDEAVWAMYERWCKAYNKDRDHAEMSRMFKLFRYQAKDVHRWNTHLPPDPEKAAVYVQKRQEAKLLISKGQDVSEFEEWYLPMELGPFVDGGDPVMSASSERLLKDLQAQVFKHIKTNYRDGNVMTAQPLPRALVLARECTQQASAVAVNCKLVPVVDLGRPRCSTSSSRLGQAPRRLAQHHLKFAVLRVLQAPSAPSSASSWSSSSSCVHVRHRAILHVVLAAPLVSKPNSTAASKFATVRQQPSDTRQHPSHASSPVSSPTWRPRF